MAAPKSSQISYFEEIYDCWKAAISHVQVRSVAINDGGSWLLLEAYIDLIPQGVGGREDEVLETNSLRFGCERVRFGGSELDQFLGNARSGVIELHSTRLKFHSNCEPSEYAPEPFAEPKYFIPQLEIRGNSSSLNPISFSHERLNAELRASPVPFAGLFDAYYHFGFGNRQHLSLDHVIRVSLHPPCDLQGRSELREDKLTITLLRKSNFDPNLVKIGLRMFPESFTRRFQVGESINWRTVEDGFDEGSIEMDLQQCSAVELLVTAGGYSVRRALIEDQDKRLNHRLTQYQVFDRNLTHLKKALLTPKDARSLEIGVAMLCHLFGASAITPPNSDTPDVLVETEGKRFAIIECTTALSDVHAKVGKLVARRTALAVQYEKNGIWREVMAVLVVNQRAELAVDVISHIENSQVVLLTLIDIEVALNHIQLPINLDDLYVRKMEELRAHLARRNPLGHSVGFN